VGSFSSARLGSLLPQAFFTLAVQKKVQKKKHNRLRYRPHYLTTILAPLIHGSPSLHPRPNPLPDARIFQKSYFPKIVFSKNRIFQKSYFPQKSYLVPCSPPSFLNSHPTSLHSPHSCPYFVGVGEDRWWLGRGNSSPHSWWGPIL